MMSLFPLLAYLLLNVYPVLFLKVSFGKSFPLTLCAAVLLYYIGGFTGNLNVGFYALLLLAVFAVYLIYRHYKDEDFRKRYFSTGFFVCLILFILVYILHIGRGFRFVDEYAHLGFMVKESWRLKQFYIVPDSNMWYNKEYPPFFPLLETLWCQFSGSFTETACYRALTFFELSLFLPFFERFSSWKKEWKEIGLLLAVFGLLGFTVGFTPELVSWSLFYNSIYIDWPIAYLLGYLFFFIMDMDAGDRRDWLFLAVYLSALILTKQIALAFWFLLAVTLLLRLLFRKKWTMRYLLVLLPLVFYVSWDSLVKGYGITAKFSFDNYDFFVFFRYLFRNANEEEAVIIKAFIDAYFKRSIILRPVGISYFSLTVLCTVLLGLYAFLRKEKRTEGILLAVMGFSGSLGYAYALMLSYVYDFGFPEGPTLAAYNRYAFTYVLALFFLLTVLYSELYQHSWKKELIALAAIFLFVNIHTISAQRPPLQYNGAYPEVIFVDYSRIINEIDPDKKVVVISQNDPAKVCALRYYADSPKEIMVLDITHPLSEDAYTSGTIYWEEDFWQLMYETDYMYICDVDESFDQYWDMVTETPLEENAMYEITHYWDYWVGVEKMK